MSNVKELSLPPAKRRILDASFSAFNLKGFQVVSMDSLAKDLKISKKTIYKHFGSKEELLETALLQLFAQIEGKLAGLQKVKNPRGVLEAYFEALSIWKLTLSVPLRLEIGSDLPYLNDRVETFERQILLRYLIGLLKDMRTADIIDYPSPSREFANSFFHVMETLVGANSEHATYFLASLLKGMGTKKKKKK